MDAGDERNEATSVTEEEIRPLKSLEELLKWKEPKRCVAEIQHVSPLCSYTCSKASTHPLTLVCHDMKGGYLDDRFYKGCKNKDAYRFYNWSGVNAFIYFSHSLVTIPPPGWVHAAHLHGVKVLGTFITEWDAGAEICNEILADKSSVQNVVLQLTRIAKYHGFEGWLLNIENKINPEQIGRLTDFVERLTSAMKEVCPNAVVLWYDSVTKEGDLKWQNELNEMNRQFFDVCDGIFLNYTWSEDSLIRSREAAGERKFDVWVGLDVFGRNFYEGGKFNTHKALEVVRAQELSAAIFAQGWTYETQENFVEAENKLWLSLSPHLCHHGPADLPFKTSFCQGFGEKLFSQGEVVCSDNWHNLCKQQYQPLWSQENNDGNLSLVTTEAFSGGGCLRVTTSKPTKIRLLTCKISWKVALVVSFTYKWQSKSTVPFSLILCHKPAAGNSTGQPSEEDIILHCEDDTKTATSENCPSLVVDTGINGWRQKTFSVPEDEEKEVCEVDIWVDGEASLLIGELHIYNRCIKGLQK